MKIKPSIGMFGVTLAALASTVVASSPATAGDSLIDRWANREVQGTFDSAKSSLALEWCIARQLPFPSVIHGEGMTEIDSLWVQLGVRIADDGRQRVVTCIPPIEIRLEKIAVARLWGPSVPFKLHLIRHGIITRHQCLKRY